VGEKAGLRVRVVRTVLAALAAFAAVVTAAVASGAVARKARAQSTTASFRSVALDSRLHYLIQLPAGYATSTVRYPVVYFLHGLPAGPTSYQSVAWVGQALAAEGKPAILVVPQGTRRANGDPEYHDWGPGRNWATALAVELPRWIDAHYRTIANRSGRAIVGVSAGGYGAASLGLGHPSQFSVVESWSGYFEPTDPTGRHVLDVGSDADNRKANVHTHMKKLALQFERYPTFFGFYVGRSDPTFVEENVELNQELSAAGIAHVYTLYPGGHSTSLWSAEAPYWLRMALSHLAPAR
jgi:enterochelin esterase-like enzyme